MNPAEELRTAASKLRKITEKTSQAPWSTHWSGQQYELLAPGREYPIAEWSYAIVTWGPKVSEQRAECDTADADYVAAMHPGVGLALATWLEHEAAGHEAVQGVGDVSAELINVQVEHQAYGATITHSTLPQALEVARQILGTAS